MNLNDNSMPKIMGILNATPDSFYSKSRINNFHLNRKKFIHANILDVGFESTRPGAKFLSQKEELARLENFISNYPNLHHTLSIDTYKPRVAKLALENGFKIINDITGGGDKGNMFKIAQSFNVPIVIMHMKGVPATMQVSPKYDNVLEEILFYFESKINLAKDIGLNDNQIILDPGIGFGKRILDNDIIIKNLDKIKALGFPVLIGVSRKSFLSYKNDLSEDRLPATLGVTALAVLKGVDIIRTHDVNDTFSMLNVVCRINQTDKHTEAIKI